MTAETASLNFPHRRYRAPAQSGELLAIPELAQCTALAARNARLLKTTAVQIGEVPLAELRAVARQEAFAAARQLAADWQLPEVVIQGEEAPLFVTGHQPVLAHPGVWVKNAVVHAAADVSGGLGLNLIVDSDLCSSWEVSLPGGSSAAPRRISVPLDDPQRQQPWEEVVVQNRKLLNACGPQLATEMSHWGIAALATTYWESIRTSPAARLVEVLSRARIVQERKWGWRNGEVTLSALSGTSTFLRMLVHLVADAEHFRHVYNGAVAVYRRWHGIKNHSHPVPDLRQIAGRIELPYWIWRSGDTRRGALFVAHCGREIELYADQQRVAVLAPGQTESNLRLLQELSATWKIRSRALATTLFARMLVADVFVHGIGGAKYDEMTDAIMRDYFGLEPPGYLTLTATLRLPLSRSTVTAERVREVQQQLRDLKFNPDRHLSPVDAAKVQARKQALIADQQAAHALRLTRRERRLRRNENQQRFRAFEELRTELRLMVDPERRTLERELAQLPQQLAANDVLGNREYAAILHAEEALKDLFHRAACGSG